MKWLQIIIVYVRVQVKKLLRKCLLIRCGCGSFYFCETINVKIAKMGWRNLR